MTAPLIRLEGIKKVFYTDEVETHALSDIHLEIQHGEYVAIAGPSGCGKTTLLSILGLLDSPSDGSYILDEQPVSRLSPADRARVRNRQIGFIFQAFNLIGDLTIYENVELPLTYRGLPGDERKKRVQAGPGAGRHVHRDEALSGAALGWSAAAGGGGASGGGRSGHSAGGRAHRESRFGEWGVRDGVAAGASPWWSNDLHGDARSPLRAPRRSIGPPVRRPSSGRAPALRRRLRRGRDLCRNRSALRSAAFGDPPVSLSLPCYASVSASAPTPLSSTS